MNISDIFQGKYSVFSKIFAAKSAPAPKTPFANNANTGNAGTIGNAAKPAWTVDITPYRPDPSMDITGRDPSSYKMVSVSDEVRNAILQNTRDEFVNGFGMSDGERASAINREYIQSVPPEDRIDVAWTLGQLHIQEANRIASLAKTAFPG